MKRVVLIANEEKFNHPYFEKTFEDEIQHSEVMRNWAKSYCLGFDYPDDFPYQWASSIAKIGSVVSLQVNEFLIFFLPNQVTHLQVELVKQIEGNTPYHQLGCVLVDENVMDDFDQKHYDSVQMIGGIETFKEMFMEEIEKRKILKR